MQRIRNLFGCRACCRSNIEDTGCESRESADVSFMYMDDMPQIRVFPPNEPEDGAEVGKKEVCKSPKTDPFCLEQSRSDVSQELQGFDASSRDDSALDSLSVGASRSDIEELRGLRIDKELDFVHPRIKQKVRVPMMSECIHTLSAEYAKRDTASCSSSGSGRTMSRRRSSPNPSEPSPRDLEDPTSPLLGESGKVRVTHWGVVVAKCMYLQEMAEFRSFEKDGALNAVRQQRTSIRPIVKMIQEKRRIEQAVSRDAEQKRRYIQMRNVRLRAQGIVDSARELAKKIAGETADIFDSEWEDMNLLAYFFSAEYVDTFFLLANATRRLLEWQPILAEVNAPCQVFGDIHGQLRDLLLLFHYFGMPSESNRRTFVFNGDFVDRGHHQLETLGILFALKLLYPQRVILVRGNHEERSMNLKYGFHDECIERLGAALGEKVFETTHKAFDQLPLACLISGKILCVHGGIGDGKWDLSDLRDLKRPIDDKVMFQESNAWILNLLWSDPIEEDDVTRQCSADVFGVHESPRINKAYQFGWNVTKTFCARNGLSLVVRSHQCKPGGRGFDVMHDEMLVRVFSARDYEGMGNDGAVLLVAEDMEPMSNGMLRVSMQVYGSAAKAAGMTVTATAGSMGVCAPVPSPPEKPEQEAVGPRKSRVDKKVRSTKSNPKSNTEQDVRPEGVSRQKSAGERRSRGTQPQQERPIQGRVLSRNKSIFNSPKEKLET